MRNIIIIGAKEFKAFFISPIGYIAISVFLLLSGWNAIIRISKFSDLSRNYENFKGVQNSIEMASHLNINIQVIHSILGFSSLLILFLFPAITMKLFAEEKRSGSMELLITSPVRLTEIIMGKFFGAFCFILVMLSFAFFFIIILFFWTTPEIPLTLSGIVGVLFLAAAILSFGIFASTLTDSQVTSFFISFGGSLFFYILNWISISHMGTLGDVANYMSILSHLVSFLRGTPSTIDIAYYLSFIGFFLYLSYRKLEMARWR